MLMPRSSSHTLSWSPRHQRYELQNQGQLAQCFRPADELAFTRWLEEQSSFAFVGQAGRLTVIKEGRSEGTSDQERSPKGPSMGLIRISNRSCRDQRPSGIPGLFRRHER